MILDNEDEASSNTCDIGSTELTRLSANDLVSTNVSQVNALDGFERELEFFEDLIADEETEQRFIEYYEQRRDYFEKRIRDYTESLRYRQAYFDIFATSIPAEITENGQRQIKHFDEDLYNVKAESLGLLNEDVFARNSIENLPAVGSDPNLKCKWNSDLQAVLMYRTDFAANSTPQAGDYNYCRYTISLISDPSIRSVGLLQATFTNIAPIANNDAYTLKWGTEQRVKVNLLENDSDDGDGTSDQVGFPTGKKSFWVDDETNISAPIKFGDIDSSLVIDAEHRVLCPDDSREWCYGGDIYIKPKNSFNKFNYTLEYQVFDDDSTISNIAEIELTSTATTSDDTRGGGGSLGVFAVLGLAGLALWRRRVKHS